MSEVVENEVIDVPGVGEIRGRPGTSTIELAGAAKYWSDRYRMLSQDLSAARRDGFFGGVVTTVLLSLLLFGIRNLIWR